MLPHHSGTRLLTELRCESATSAIPVIVLTARIHESDELVGFALGADDLLFKPFSIQLLLARVRAVLRRAIRPIHDSSRLSIGPFTLSKERNEVIVGDEPLPLTRTEFQLLKEVLAAAGRVVRRDRLIERVFATTDSTDRRIDVHMTNLRRKLRSAAPWIQTIGGWASLAAIRRKPLISTCHGTRWQIRRKSPLIIDSRTPTSAGRQDFSPSITLPHPILQVGDVAGDK
jgi:two-component system, OmpR family, phosphate regulon response regulator PhoB